MPITHDISALSNLPDASGVSSEANFGRNCTGQPRVQPFASMSKFAVENKITKNR